MKIHGYISPEALERINQSLKHRGSCRSVTMYYMPGVAPIYVSFDLDSIIIESVGPNDALLTVLSKTAA